MASAASIRKLPRETNREVNGVGLSASLVLIAAGAILYWAVTASLAGVSVNTVGVVLMIVGAVGLLLSFVFWSSWGGFRGRRTPA